MGEYKGTGKKMGGGMNIEAIEVVKRRVKTRREGR